MSATLQVATAQANIAASENVVQGSGSGPIADSHSINQNYQNGTNPGQAQHCVSAVITVNNTGTTLDLSALAGGAEGSTRNFSSIQEVLIENQDTTNSVNVGPGASNGWAGITGNAVSGSLPLEPASAGVAGGSIKRASPGSGVTVDGTHKTILIAAAAGTAQVRYTFLGRGS